MHFYQLLNLIQPRSSTPLSVLRDKRRGSFHVHLCGIVLFWMTSWSTLKEMIINWTWDMVAGRESIITISITGKWIPCNLFFCCLLKKNRQSDRGWACAFRASFCMCASMFGALEDLNADSHFMDAPIITMWDWLFDCFQGVSAKSLFCDYRLIICPLKRLSSAISRFHCPGLSGGWAFDWQLVNDVISILLGKWSSGDSRLVSERGTVICYGWCVVDDGWRGRLRERGTAQLSCLRRDWGEERRRARMEADESVCPALHYVH